MVKKIFVKCIGILISVLFVLMFVNVKLDIISQLNNIPYLTLSDVSEINQNLTFGGYVSSELDNNLKPVNDSAVYKSKLQIKLFGLFKIKEVDVLVGQDQLVFVGGVPLGFAINTDGLIVVGESSERKNIKDFLNSNTVKVGDVIVSINGNKVQDADGVKKIINEAEKDSLDIEVIRNKEKKVVQAKIIEDKISQQKKLGFWVRNDAQGVGTLTFVEKNNKFGALGHCISDYETGIEVPIAGGNIYNCNIIGINKGEKGKTGELRCLFMHGKNSKGKLEKNTKCGVFGNITNRDGIIDENFLVKVGSRLSMKLGAAKIVSAVEGIRQEYDIEIVKLNYQSNSNDKGFIFRVKDQKLIDVTGGIVQGMSGSPIIQDGKFVGAVTHVFLNDPTKGYGVYSDWMVSEVE